jgi:hypothetical protein
MNSLLYTYGMKEISSEQYLKRIESEKGKLPESEINAALVRLNTPFREVEYGEQGTERIETENFAFEFSYSPIETPEQRQDIERRMARDGIPPEIEFAKPINWRKLKTLVFEVKQGERIDLFEKLPADAEILFCPTNEEFHGSIVSPPVRIHILGNLAAPRSLVTLLHEVGHVFDDANLEKLGVESMVKGWDSGLGEKLRKERSASAFAFKVIKSALPEGQLRTDARIFLKSYALENYRTSIKMDIAHNEMMSRHYQKDYDYYAGSPGEEDERRLWDDYAKWRATGAYREWKMIPEHAAVSIEKGDEFGHWRGWVEKSGYDYYKDIYPEGAGESL